MENFGWDVGIILGSVIVALLFAAQAYRAGAPVWRRRFCIPELNPHDRGLMCSGMVGECINLGMIALVLFVILLLAADADLYKFFTNYPVIPLIVGPWTFFMLAGFFFIFVIGEAKSKGIGHGIVTNNETLYLLTRGYVYYLVYATIVCCLILLVVAITVSQFLYDNAQFTRITNEIHSKFEALDVYLAQHPPALSSFLQEKFEEIIGKATIARGYIVEQMNSILMLLLCIVVVHTAVARTGLRRVYSDMAFKALTGAVILCALFAVSFGTWVFFTMHLTFVDSLLESLRSYEIRMNKGPWDVTQRYHELISDFSARRGIFGFVVSLAGDRGGLLLLIPAVQWVLSRNSDAGKSEKTRAKAPARARPIRHGGRIARRARI